MSFCLTRDQENKLRNALVAGKLDPFKLSEMSSEQRRAEFEKYIDPDNAANVNSLFESKLLLKNQITGFKTWANSLVGLKPKVKRDLLTKIDRLNELGVLNPSDMKSFSEDLARTRLGFAVTFEEAKAINDLSKKVESLKEKTDITKSDIELGRAKIDLLDYVSSLKPVKRDLIANVAGLPRSIMASLDLSAPLNQGWGMISRKRFYTALGSMLKTVKSENNFKNLHAWIITHPDYNTAKRAGLRITEIGDNLNKREEQFMSKLVDRVPGISASQRAYVGFLNKLRMDSFSDTIRKAEAKGENVELGSSAAKDIADMVNSFTGGASVGRVEGAVPLLNALFFSPRKIKSTINMMNPATYVNPKTSKTARIEATRNLVGSLAMSLSALLLYSLLTGEELEADPTSSDFGKIKSGDTRMDVTGGNATYINFLSRIISGRRKNSSGVSTKLGTGYGETSAFDVIAQFIRYKLSPNASFLVDAVTGENAIGEEKTVAQSAIDRFKPLFLESIVELLDSDTSGKFGFMLVGLLGAGLSTYSNDADWETKTTKEMVDFKEQVGEAKFKEANEKYNQEYDKWFEGVRGEQTYKNLTDEEKKDYLTSIKRDIKNKILKEYGYVKTKKTETGEELRKKQELEKLKPISQLNEEIKKGGTLDSVINLLSDVHDKLIPDALAAEDGFITKEEWENEKNKPSILEKIGSWFKGLFSKDLISPEGSPLVKEYIDEEGRTVWEIVKPTVEPTATPTEKQGEVKGVEVEQEITPIPTSAVIPGFKEKERRKPDEQIGGLIKNTANKKSIEPAVMASIFFSESGFNPNAKNVNRNGSVDLGIAQINLSTHPNVTEEQALNPNFAIPYATGIIQQNLKTFDGDYAKAITAYNRGAGRVRSQGLDELGRQYLNKVVAGLDSATLKKLGLKDKY